ncbi:MAG: hypothetical protein K5890_12395 [Bacteroidales bacterium]|nr:hypothetical protein [Bacteroidales bacterium]
MRIDNDYEQTIKLVCDCGNIINNSSTLTDMQKNVFCDLLYRIKRNCSCLRKLTDCENDYLTVRLVHRSIFEDLITIFFFLSLKNNSSEFTDALAIMDVKSMNSIKKWIKVHESIDKINAEAKGVEFVTDEEYFESFNSVIEQHPSFKGRSLSQLNDTKLNNIKFNGKPSEMVSYVKNTEFENPIRYLYAEYRFLSQIEHYCSFNRGFSYYNFDDETINIHKKVVEFFIKYLFKVVSELLQ